MAGMSQDEPQVIRRQVPNPAYEDLEDLLETVQRARAAHADTLRQLVQLLAQGAWTGPTQATTFAAELQGRHTDLPSYFDELVAAVQARMAQVPATRTVSVKVW